ncbi:MAG: DNA polymerase III subunit alpha [Planctomycetes bacterium]|nr:DNA polymerase III subunit alpha [Planctomycetota bacterium]
MALLLARTHYSLLTAPASPQALCEEAVRLGLSHLVLADANGLYGLYPFARAAQRVGLQALFGCELVHRDRRVVVIAEDRRGYASLCALLSAFHLQESFDLVRACERHAAGLWFVCGDPRVLPELSVRVPRERLCVALPPRGDDARDGARDGASDAASDAARDGARGRGGAPTPHHTPGRKLPDPGPVWPRRMLRELAADLELPLCAVRDVWFATPADHALHELFLAVKWNRALRSPGAGGAGDLHGDDLRGIRRAGPSAHLPTPAQLAAGHGDAPDATATAARLLASCTLTFAERAAPIFPPVRLPDGETAEQRLRGLVQAGLRRRYGDGAAPRDDARSRCEHELAVIERMGFAPYFLAVNDIVELARQRDIPFVGRGSAADSLVAHCLGLTDADPLRYGLLFERFLNPGRSDLPDIDLDFCWRRRDELIDAVYEHFGREHVAMIATYNTCGPRAAYQEAAKVLGLPPEEAARRSKRLPWHGRAGMDLAAVAAETPGFWTRDAARGRVRGGRGDGVEASDALPPERERLLLALAQQLLDAPRHLGVHPGGVVITPDPIATHAPLERAQKGVVVTQYDMHFVEGLGMVKIDLLGNRALSIVHDCVTSLQRHGVVVPDLQRIAEDDPRTAQLLQNGGTLGCFQVESPAMRTLLQQTGAGTMDRVIQAVALVRPGPASSGMKDAFVRRARGLEPVAAAHPLLAEVFADTFGIMLYQEDVIRAAMAVAGLDATRGDVLRRDLNKRGRSHELRDEREAFVVQGLKRGLPRAAIEQVWQEMARFAAYSFCKAHSVTYGRLAYRCVWLKARWPAAFLCAMLRNDAGYFAPGVYAEEAKRLGAELLAPCVQQGQPEHELVGASAIRVGLATVRGTGERTVAAILTAREAGGPFRSLPDFLQRVRPSRDEAESLIKVGALDALGVTRPELLWRLSVATTPRAQKAAERAASTGSANGAARSALFADAVQPREASYPQLPDFDERQRADAELFLLGFTLGSHPVDVLWRRGELPVLARCTPCGKVHEHVGQRVRVCGFAVAFRGHSIRHGPDVAGGMCFVTVEDGSGIVETTLFPKVYQRCGAVLQGRGPFVFEGKVEERLGGGVGLIVFEVRAPDAAERSGAR